MIDDFRIKHWNDPAGVPALIYGGRIIGRKHPAPQPPSVSRDRLRLCVVEGAGQIESIPTSDPSPFRLTIPSGVALPRTVLTASIALAMALLGDAMLYAVLPAKAASLGIPIALVGVLLSVNRWVRIATNFGAASAFDRWGVRRGMIAGSILTVASTAAYGVFPFFAAMLPARLAWGAAFSLLRLGAYRAVLLESATSNRGRIMGMFQSVSWIGSMTGALVGGILVEAIGFRATAVAFGAVGLLSLGLSSRVGKRLDAVVQHTAETGAIRNLLDLVQWRPESRVDSRRHGRRARGYWSRRAEHRSPSLYDVRGLSRCIWTGRGRRGGRRGFVAVRFGSETVLAPVMGVVSDRFGRLRIALLTGLLMAVGLGILFSSASLAAISVGALIVFGASSGLQVSLSAWAGDLARENNWTTVMSGYATFRDIGTAIGPLLALPLAAVIGVRPIYAIAAVILVAALTLLPRESTDPEQRVSARRNPSAALGVKSAEAATKPDGRPEE